MASLSEKAMFETSPRCSSVLQYCRSLLLVLSILKNSTEPGKESELKNSDVNSLEKVGRTNSLKPFDYFRSITPTFASLFQEVMVRTKIQSELQKEKQKNQEEITILREGIKLLLDQLSEIETFNGNTLWKVSLFNQKMTDAQTTEQAVICSQPFYLEKLHYKACLQLYPNGKGGGNNSHMSLFLVIMKGEFDDQLHWPLTLTITFKLINQTGDGDIVHTFQAEPINRPESDDDCGSGCLRFASHTDLQKSGFIEDDTIFILCDVNPD